MVTKEERRALLEYADWVVNGWAIDGLSRPAMRLRDVVLAVTVSGCFTSPERYAAIAESLAYDGQPSP